MRREAARLWMTPLEEALLMRLAAALNASGALPASEGRGSRRFFTASFTVVRTLMLRARRFCAWRLRFSADLVLAKVISSVLLWKEGAYLLRRLPERQGLRDPRMIRSPRALPSSFSDGILPFNPPRITKHNPAKPPPPLS